MRTNRNKTLISRKIFSVLYTENTIPTSVIYIDLKENGYRQFTLTLSLTKKFGV